MGSALEEIPVTANRVICVTYRLPYVPLSRIESLA